MDIRQFIVTGGEAGQRLDRWLSAKIPDLSRNQIKHLIDLGKVLVNQRRVLVASWEMELHDSVEVRIPAGLPAPTADEERAPRESPKRGRFLDILFEDKDLIVVNKPSGVLSEPKRDSPHEHLLGMIKGYLARKHKGSKGSYVSLLHRLDRDTSGVMVAALSKVGEQLEDQFRRHEVDRQYLALVEGQVEKEEQTIRFPLEKGDFEGGRKVKIVPEGKGMKALTHCRVKERYPNATLLTVRVDTGRTHQVRIHMAEIGHPLIGDKIYGAGTFPFPRHALHALILGFNHPRTKRRMRFESKLAADLEQLVDQLRGSV